MATTAINVPSFLRDRPLSGSDFVIDVRTPAEFRSTHLEGSENVPLDQLSVETCQQLAGRTQGENVYLICGSGMRATRASDILAEHTACVVVEGGISALEEHGAPLVKNTGGVISLERQVRIAAGALVVIGVLLGMTVNPAFYALSAFVGLGLVFAGVTDTCGMAMMLSRMPWNKVRA